MESTKLCPKCGAYWQCGCRLEELAFPVQEGCNHDWTEAVGVEVDLDIEPESVSVLVCRLCGLYAVQEKV